MKKKRQKKLAREWTDFQQRHELSDACRKLARAIGHLPKLLEEMLASPDFEESTSIAARIGELHRCRQEEREQHAAAIESGEIQPKAKKRKKEVTHDPQWAKAKQVCRLNIEDIRMAKELGMSPKSLIKNVPSSSQTWKAPVKIWIRELYEKRQQQATRLPSDQPAIAR